MPQTICVTGAAGVVGAATVHELLAHGYHVIATDIAPHPATLPAQWSRPDFQYTRADLTDYGDTVEVLTGADAVVHIANIPAPTLLPPARTLTANTSMNGNVFLAAASLGLRRVVYASSETTLGLNFEVPPRYAPLDEDHYPYPTTSYALSKVLTETMADAVSGWSGIPFVGLRFSNVIRPTDYERFPSFWDDPESRRFNLWSYIDVRDCALSARLALEAGVTGATSYIIAAADTVMTTPSARLMAEVFPATRITRELGEFESLMTIDRARAALGFEPRYSWRDILPI
ncbi:NAD-dependent epimerase/dehydratase family protein [Acrocarpospora catenulata]|uniref:NAD-dependent epimerase/dehydratase family protein n=1 Tax=Acrocarpospora catenulata TaxID=2836182 RepID=UPI001BDB182B|nr:NAD(P)-dependent oxidoreductase [Acrocarpospora catenulata]